MLYLGKGVDKQCRFRSDCSWEQSDLGLHCLLFYLNVLKSIPFVQNDLIKFYAKFQEILSVVFSQDFFRYFKALKVRTRTTNMSLLIQNMHE